jgi:hypothetical protein
MDDGEKESLKAEAKDRPLPDGGRGRLGSGDLVR